jgi:membrane protease YdiL (CAAX protease family)
VAPAALLGLRFVAGVGILAVGPTVAMDLLRQAGMLAPRDDAERMQASMLVFVLACGGVVGFACWQRPGLPWRPVHAPLVVAAWLPFVLVWVGLLVAYLGAARGLGLAVPPQPALEHLARADFSKPGSWWLVVGPVLGAPLAEEIVFRGYLQPALTKVLRPAFAIALTAAVFGAVHTLPYALPVALLGAFFGLLAHRLGSLWPAVLCHCLHNALTVVVTVFWPQSLTMLYSR